MLKFKEPVVPAGVCLRAVLQNASTESAGSAGTVADGDGCTANTGTCLFCRCSPSLKDCVLGSHGRVNLSNVLCPVDCKGTSTCGTDTNKCTPGPTSAADGGYCTAAARKVSLAVVVFCNTLQTRP